ncbi:MAG TPA: hypothetical protein ACFYDZ_10600 [Candidatus Brocadiaceae bacterium]
MAFVIMRQKGYKPNDDLKISGIKIKRNLEVTVRPKELNFEVSKKLISINNLRERRIKTDLSW